MCDETTILLAWVEVPGLYVQPDTGFVYALDHEDELFFSFCRSPCTNSTSRDNPTVIQCER